MIEDGDKGMYVRTIDDLVALIDKNLWINKQVRTVFNSKINIFEDGYKKVKFEEWTIPIW